MGKEVSCRPIALLLDFVKDRGLSQKVLLNGISYNLEHLQNKHERIDWAAYCQFMKNLHTVFDEDDFFEFGRLWAQSKFFRPWAIVVRIILNLGRSLPLAQKIVDNAGQQFFAGIHFHLDELRANGFKITLRTRNGYEFCPEHFLVVKGSLSVIPTIKSYQTARVVMKWINRGAIFEVTESPKLEKVSWLYKKILWIFSSRAAIQAMIEANDALLERYRELEEARNVQEILSQKLLETREGERKRISAELHDEIGGNLCSIAMIAEMLKSKLSPGEPERKSLKQISGLAHATSESMRDIVWFINPDNDSMAKLLIKMRDTANLMLEPLDFSFTAPAEGIIPEADLHFRRNLYLIYKECLQNILKHARASKVEIEIRESEGCVHLRISDDGSGFDTARNYPGDGLKNIQRRAAELGATVEIISGMGKGATVTIAAKIP